MTDRVDPVTFTPEDSPLTIEDIAASPKYLDLMSPDVGEGDPAPEVTLARPGASGEPVTIGASAADRPVALIFGSYT